MPASNPVVGGPTLQRGISDRFSDTYTKRYQGVLARLGKSMELGIPTDQFESLYGYGETAPHFGRWAAGTNIPRRNFRYRSFTTVNYRWGGQVDWDNRQELYNQLGSIRTDAARAGDNLALLPERVYYQIITGTTDAQLLPAIPNAPDGSAIYATTRFGVAAGNQLTGSGVADEATLLGDIFDAIELALSWQDTDGQPLLDEEMVKEIVLTFNSNNLLVYERAVNQTLQARAATSATSNAGVSNILQESGFDIQLVPTQRITDNASYLNFPRVGLPAVFEQVALPLQEQAIDANNSDWARENDMSALQWKTERGYGVNQPISTLKITSA